MRFEQIPSAVGFRAGLVAKTPAGAPFYADITKSRIVAVLWYLRYGRPDDAIPTPDRPAHIDGLRN